MLKIWKSNAQKAFKLCVIISKYLFSYITTAKLTLLDVIYFTKYLPLASEALLIRWKFYVEFV